MLHVANGQSFLGENARIRARITCDCRLSGHRLGCDSSFRHIQTKAAAGVTGSTVCATATVYKRAPILFEGFRWLRPVRYLDEDLRIVRNELDDQVFVYARA